MIYRDALFLLFVILISAESKLTRLLGKMVSTLMLAVSGIGLCCLLAAYMAEAM